MVLLEAASDTGVLRAQSGQETEIQSQSGPGTYDSGFSIRSKLGRVDEFTVDTDNGSWEARADSITSVGSGAGGQNIMVVTVFSQSTAVEAPNDEDLSSVSFTTTAYRL